MHSTGFLCYIRVSYSPCKTSASLYANTQPSCENEFRQCLQSYEEDNQEQQVLENWHSGCDHFITFPLSTPVLSTLASSIGDPAVCSEIETVCTEGGSITRDCKQSYGAATDSSGLTSCLCQSSLLSAASRCEFDGNITCSEQTAALSNIDLWILCPVSNDASPW